MRRPGQWAFIAAWIFISYSSLVAFSEWTLLTPPSARLVYFPLKIFFIALAIPAAFLIRDNIHSARGNLLMAISLVMYTCVSEYFRPYYEFAYAELMLMFAFAFAPNRRLFFTAIFGGGVLVTAIAWFRFDYLRPLMAAPAFSVFPLTVGAFGVISLFIYVSFSRERHWREAAMNRFGLIGQHSSTLVHDLKSQLTIPMLQVENLQRQLGPMLDAEAKDSFADIEKSLTEIARVVREINRMGKLAEQEPEWFSMQQLAYEVAALIKPRLSTVSVSIEGEFELLANRPLMSSIFLALFVNAIEAFNSSKPKHPQIHISIKEGCLRFSDNGGGFKIETLKLLKSGQPTTSKDGGTGLGLFLVRSGITEVGGRAKFFNEAQRAMIEMSLPKRAWRPFSAPASPHLSV